VLTLPRKYYLNTIIIHRKYRKDSACNSYTQLFKKMYSFYSDLILQDANRLDAIGAIGITRTFSVGGSESRSRSSKDSLCESNREPDDTLWTLDHIKKKLLIL
jgi:HD superfamily phosphodiesterase